MGSRARDAMERTAVDDISSLVGTPLSSLYTLLYHPSIVKIES